MEEKDYILLPEDLQKAMKINGLPGRLLSRAAYRLLDLHRINAMQRKLRGITGPDFADRVLEEVGVTYDIAPEDLDRIPAQGGFITVSNHPFGSIDGLTLCATVARRRPDYRVLTTFLLALIPLTVMIILFTLVPSLTSSTSFMIIPAGALAIALAWIKYRKASKGASAE